MKRHVRRSKYDPLVEEVDVIEVNPSTSHVRTVEGRELTVSNRHLAPVGSADTHELQAGTSGSIENASPPLLFSDTDTTTDQSFENDAEHSDSDHNPVLEADIDSASNVVDSLSANDNVSESGCAGGDYVRFSTRNRKQTEFYGVNNN